MKKFGSVFLGYLASVGGRPKITAKAPEEPSAPMRNASRILGTSIRRIPDCGDFKIEVSDYDAKAFELGFKRKLPPKIEITPGKNRKMNKYLEHQVKRLLQARNSGNFELYWRIAERMMLSDTYLVSCLNQTLPNWHRHLNLGSVISYCKGVRKLSIQKARTIDYCRVYIPKKDGSARPLGVPTRSGRIYMCMWSNLFTIFLQPHISKNQHGYQPGKGVLSCGRFILAEVIPSKNIYEFDLKKFFDRVSNDFIECELTRLGVPSDLVSMVAGGNDSVPLFLNSPQVASDHKYFVDDYGNPDPNYDLEMGRRGVAQGGALSPFLSLLTLEQTVFKVDPVVMYADDGLFFGDTIRIDAAQLNESPQFLKAGVSLHEGKSGWVKKDGIWARPLKFLGFIYDPSDDTLRSECRSGTTLELSDDVKALVMASHAEPCIKMTGLPKSTISAILKREGEELDSRDSSDLAGYVASVLGTATKHKFTGEMLASSTFMGFILSRMTLGKGNPTDVLQNFSLTLKSQRSFVHWWRNLQDRAGRNELRRRKLSDFELEQWLFRVSRLVGIPRLRRTVGVSQVLTKHGRDLRATGYGRPSKSQWDHPCNVELSVFNASSIACGSLVGMLKVALHRKDFLQNETDYKPNASMERARSLNSMGFGFYDVDGLLENAKKK